MNNRQQRFLVGVAVVFSILLMMLTTESVITFRVSSWVLLIVIGFLSLSKDLWVSTEINYNTSSFVKCWVVVSVVCQLVIVFKSLFGPIDLTGFVLERLGFFMLLLFLPGYGSLVLSACHRYKELGKT